MKRYSAVHVGGALGAQLSEGDWESFRKSNLPWLLLVLNTLGAVAHGTGVALVRSQARLDFTLRIWHSLLINHGNTTHPIWERGQDVTHINPSSVITAFFSLSLCFHVTIAAYIALSIAMPEARWTQWYMWGLYHNMAPWRWLEYLVSAPLMLLLAAPLMGIREIHSIAAVVGSLGVTILFGWITELHGADKIETAAVPYRRWGWELTRRWEEGSWRIRWQIHLLGYAPYALCWWIVFDRFRLNMQALVGIVPDFVNVTVVSSFILFTFFGITQLLHQALPYGPSLYWLGEVIYVTLSFTAKANLGFVVLYEALVPGSIFDNQLNMAIIGT